MSRYQRKHSPTDTYRGHQSIYYSTYKFCIFLFVVPSSDEIKKLVVANGGVFQHYYAVSKVTHIIASNLPTSKIQQIRDKKIIRPDWIVNRLLDILVAISSDL